MRAAVSPPALPLLASLNESELTLTTRTTGSFRPLGPRTDLMTVPDPPVGGGPFFLLLLPPLLPESRRSMS